MSQIPLRSVRLNARPATTLQSFVGTAGEVFYDGTNQTLRVYPGNSSGGKILADRDWVNTAVAAIGSSSIVNGSRTVSLSSTGTLTIPGDIRSEGNINIDINLSDSTLQRWSFGEDGVLTLPGGGNINTFDGYVELVAGSNVDADASVGLLSNNSLNLMKVDNAGAYIVTTDTFNTTWEWNFGTNGTTQFPNSTLFNINDFKILAPNVTLQSTGAVTVRASQGIPSAIGAISGYSGNWSLIPRTNLPTTVYYGLGTGLTVTILESGGVPYGVTIVNPGSGYENGQSVNVSSGSATISFPIIVSAIKDWTFGTTGALTIPGDIRSEGNISIEINLADSTLRRWQFSEDGQLTFPDGGNLRVSGIPATSIGLAGDTEGMLAFNASYAYYCTANYDGVTNIWRRTAHDVATW